MPGMKPAAKDIPENFTALPESFPPLSVEVAVAGAVVASFEEVEDVRVREDDGNTVAVEAVLDKIAELVLSVPGSIWQTSAWHVYPMGQHARPHEESWVVGSA